MTKFTVDDCRFMARAIRLAQRGRYTTPPNPNVGCVIVRDGQILGEGYHLRAGEGHAEVQAIAAAQGSLQGATVYVTLEPCSHFGRTPPCANALIEQRVAEVVIAMKDPNPQVAGRGISMLEQAGVGVRSGLMQAQAQGLNPGFLSRMCRKRPFVRLKMGTSLDGKTALANGVSQWITSPLARADVQRERAASHGILSTAQTVLEDKATLTVRPHELGWLENRYPSKMVRQPWRVIIDRQQRLTGREPLFQTGGRIIRVVDKPCNAEVGETLLVPQSDSWLSDMMQALAKLEVNDLWVEAGANLAGSLLDEHLVDHLLMYQAAVLIGDAGRSLANTKALEQMNQLSCWSILDQRPVGPDWKTTFVAPSE